MVLTTRMVTYPRRRPIASLPVKNGERERTELAAVTEFHNRALFPYQRVGIWALDVLQCHA